VREFRAALPMVIFSKGFLVIPCTLEIGDYILSPRYAIERKSPSDLSQSLKSGRLFKQSMQLCSVYSKPLVLIEFQSLDSFGLRFSPFESGELDTPSRLVLLVLNFPKIGLLWSCSPQETVEMFNDLQVFLGLIRKGNCSQWQKTQ
jgi:DNA excision repair protein ERCC-4